MLNAYETVRSWDEHSGFRVSGLGNDACEAWEGYEGVKGTQEIKQLGEDSGNPKP